MSMSMYATKSELRRTLRKEARTRIYRVLFGSIKPLAERKETCHDSQFGGRPEFNPFRKGASINSVDTAERGEAFAIIENNLRTAQFSPQRMAQLSALFPDVFAGRTF